MTDIASVIGRISTLNDTRNTHTRLQAYSNQPVWYMVNNIPSRMDKEEEK